MCFSCSVLFLFLGVAFLFVSGVSLRLFRFVLWCPFDLLRSFVFVVRVCVVVVSLFACYVLLVTMRCVFVCVFCVSFRVCVCLVCVFVFVSFLCMSGSVCVAFFLFLHVFVSLFVSCFVSRYVSLCSVRCFFFMFH